MSRRSVLGMKVSKIYSLLIAKVQRKGRAKEEVDETIARLMGHDMKEIDQEITYANSLGNAPAYNPRTELIKGSVCDVRVESIDDPLMKRVRQLDKLVDELAKGKPIEKVLR